jgi:hypothetical protein
MLMISRNTRHFAIIQQLASNEYDDWMENTLESVQFAAGHASHIH